MATHAWATPQNDLQAISNSTASLCWVHCSKEDRFSQPARPLQMPTDSSSTETDMHARRLTFGCSEPGDTRTACLPRSFVGTLQPSVCTV